MPLPTKKNPPQAPAKQPPAQPKTPEPETPSATDSAEEEIPAPPEDPTEGEEAQAAEAPAEDRTPTVEFDEAEDVPEKSKAAQVAELLSKLGDLLSDLPEHDDCPPVVAALLGIAKPTDIVVYYNLQIWHRGPDGNTRLARDIGAHSISNALSLTQVGDSQDKIEQLMLNQISPALLKEYADTLNQQLILENQDAGDRRPRLHPPTHDSRSAVLSPTNPKYAGRSV